MLRSTVTLLALTTVAACAVGGDGDEERATSEDPIRAGDARGCALSARLVELTGPIERAGDIPPGADGRPRDTGGKPGAYFAFGIDVKNDSDATLGAIRIRQRSYAIADDGTRREIARADRVVDFPGRAGLAPGATLPIRSVMVRRPGDAAFFGRNRVRFELECGDGSVEPAVVEFDTVRPQRGDQRLSCGDVATRDGFRAARCEHNGNGACSGRSGSETLDCLVCCDGD